MAIRRGQNEGSIRQRPNGKWEARYTIGVDASGKQKQKSIYGKTRAEVSKKLNQLLNDINKGVYVEITKITVETWLDTWMKEYKKAFVKPKTYDSYYGIIEIHITPSIGYIHLNDLRAEHIQKLYNNILKKNLSTRTVKYVHSLLHGALSQAVKNGLIVRNVTDSTTLPKQIKKEMRCFSLEEQNKFLKALDGHRYKLAFQVLLTTGLRRGEILALKWQDIDFKEGTLKVCRTLNRVRTFEGEGRKTEIVIGEPKSEKGKRVIPLLDGVLVELNKHRKLQEMEKRTSQGTYVDNGFIFCNELGKHIDTRTFEKYFKNLLKKANVEGINLHGLRHTFATRGLENGISPKVMQEILGHSTINLTMDTYTHVLPNVKKEAINLLKECFKVV
jgi:integrase